MTNLEMIKILEDMQNKHLPIDWGFAVEQTDKEIKVTWGYLDGITWTIDKEFLAVRNEHGEFSNNDLMDNSDLVNILESIAYYMATRY